jgi:glycosyltransferase involved in cell wall biosynthesis
MRYLARNAERHLAWRTDAFAAVSEAERLQLSHLALDEQSAFLVPHAIAAAAKPLPLNCRAARIVSVGRINYQKNPESVADLPRRVLHRLPRADFEFVWLGDGDPARRSLLQSQGWRVTGWLSHSQVRTIVSTSTLTIHPARYEGLPLSVLESLGVGTPVIAANLPAYRELSSILRYESAAELESAVISLITQPNAWSRLATDGWQHVTAHFNRRTQDAALSKLYEFATRRSSSGA